MQSIQNKKVKVSTGSSKSSSAKDVIKVKKHGDDHDEVVKVSKREKKKDEIEPEDYDEVEEQDPDEQPDEEDDDEDDEDDDDDDDDDDEDDDDEEEDDDDVSFNTNDILENDPLYFVLSKIFQTSDENHTSIADLMQQVVQRLDTLIEVAKKANKKSSS